MRAAAEDLDLRHRQQRRVGSAEVLVQRHARAPRRRRGPRPSTPRASRWRRAGTCSACRRARSAAASSAAWSSAAMPITARAISPLTLRDRALHVEAAEARGRRRAARAPRACPCDAPAGTIARPTAPPSSVTSASTVGRPRLSQTRRACTKRISLGFRRLLIDQPVAGARLRRRRSGGPADHAAVSPAPRRTSSPLRLASVMYSTGDLPSTRASSSPGSSAAARRSSAARGSQSTCAR